MDFEDVYCEFEANMEYDAMSEGFVISMMIIKEMKKINEGLRLLANTIKGRKGNGRD